MRPFTLVLIALLAALQWPLWLGKGSWLRVWQLDAQLLEQRTANENRAMRNLALTAEVNDLKQGLNAIEERARSELGMVKPEEVFFQILERQPGPPPTTFTPSSPATVAER